MRANCHVGHWCECVGRRVSERAGVARIFLYTLPVYVQVWLSARLSWQLFWNVWRSWQSFRSIRQSASFSSYFSSFLSELALGPTVILRVYSCLDLGPETGRLHATCVGLVNCFSSLFSSVRMAVINWWNGPLALVVFSLRCAATHLKYRRCRLSCLPFIWHFFFIVTHTHPHTHKHPRTNAHVNRILYQLQGGY